MAPVHPQTESRLLCLPAELRSMIWESAVSDTPILLLCRQISPEIKYIGKYLGSETPPQVYTEWTCQKKDPEFHTAKSRKAKEQSSQLNQDENPHPGPLSWLRTSRQIHTEAKHLLQSNLRLHICSSQLITRIKTRSSLAHRLQLSQLRSLSICMKLPVQYDLHDSVHLCGYCPRIFSVPFYHKQNHFHAHTPSPKDQFPQIQVLKLQVYFGCLKREAIERLRVRHSYNGRPKKERLNTPRHPTALSWVCDDNCVERLANAMYSLQPLMALEGVVEFVEVDFCTDKIEHTYPPGDNGCWSEGKIIGDSFPAKEVEEVIRSRLLG